MSTFARLPPRLQDAIASRLGWTGLRPVQELAGAAILDGNNAVVLAPTAGGKTEASMFPVLAGLMDREPEGVGALYVAPIKALLNNQEERLGTYTEMVGLRRFVWHGDVSASDRRRFVDEPAELLMLTPESIEVMLISPRVPAQTLFRDLRYVVIDEVHAFAGTDRGAHLMSVLERLARFTGNDIQRIGLSATVGNPEAILAWLAGSSRREGVVVDPPKTPVRRQLLVTLGEGTGDIARKAAARAKGHKSLFFCQSRSVTESIAERMRGRGTDVFVHHSSVSLEERRAAEDRFHHGTDACIVCTSTLELGIDVGDLDLVFQENAANSVSSFLQRMGRTGRRADTLANTTFFCDDDAAVPQAVALIELARSGWVESVPNQTRCWPVLAHQLFALTLEREAIAPQAAWEQLARVPDFRGIAREEFDGLIAHMVADDYLFESGGELSLGQRAERVFGRKNFMELYAVFSSPVLYRVQTVDRRDLGALEQGYVDRLVDEVSSFLLGGRAWTVEHVNHSEKTVRVRPSPWGHKPSWGGFVPRHLGYALCQKMRDVLADEQATYPYLDSAARKSLEAAKEDLGPLLRSPGVALRDDDGAVRWWTFAGGRVNHTLKYALEWLRQWKVVADNFLVRIEGEGVGPGDVAEAIAEMSAPGFWDDEATRLALEARVPEYRLSKFQRVLPASAAAEMVGAYLLGLDDAARYLECCRRARTLA